MGKGRCGYGALEFRNGFDTGDVLVVRSDDGEVFVLLQGVLMEGGWEKRICYWDFVRS